jgi:hypothetical protein
MKIQQSVTSVRDQVAPGEWQQRVTLAAAYRLVARFGWDDLVFTHLSARVPGRDLRRDHGLQPGEGGSRRQKGHGLAV